MRKVRVQTIRGFCRENLGPSFCAIILGSHMQTPDPHAIFWDRAAKPRPSAATNPRSIAHSKQLFAAKTSDPHARNLLGSHNQTSAIRSNTQPNLGHPRQQTHDRLRTQSSSVIRCNEPTLPRMAKLLCVRVYIIYIYYAQSTDSDHPRILLPKPRIRALRYNPRITHANLGSEDLLCKPRIRMQSSRIAQPNLGHPRQQTHDRSAV